MGKSLESVVYEEHTAGCSGHPGPARWPSDTGTDTLGRPFAPRTQGRTPWAGPLTLGHWD